MDDFNFEVFEEDLMDISEDVVEPEVVNAPAVNPSKQVSTKNNISFDFSSLGNIKGVISGNVGMKVSRLRVERCKFTTEKRELISIVADNVIAIKTHYHEEVGNILCFDGECCEMCDLPRIKYLFPVVVYETAKSGKPISKNLEFKCLSVGADVYEDICALADLKGDISDLDLLVTCKDAQYQKISITDAGPARWKQEPRLTKQVVEFWNDNMKYIVQSTAKEIRPEIFREKMGLDSGPVTGNVSFDDVFGD